MQLVDGRPIYAATDLVGFLACAHLTDLERAALGGLVERPQRDDPELDLIAERGKLHELAYLAGLQQSGRSVASLDEERPEWESRLDYYRRKAAQTRAAIRRGDDVIFQACFFDGTWLGFADFLLRVEDREAPLGWSYEVADTKLAHRVRASALLQICVYNELLEAIQGVYPERMHVALGGRDRETKTFRTADFRAYHRMVKARFLGVTGAAIPTDPDAYPPPPPSYPEPVEHCGVCRWDEICSRRRRADDHLSLVAGIASRTRVELVERGTGTRRGLAVLELPIVPRLEHTGAEALTRVREQARIQVEGEDEGRIKHELLELITTKDGSLDTTRGLLALPLPSPGDLFLDLEGDPFAGDDGMDYLFGLLEPWKLGADGQPLFHAFWSRDATGEVTEAAEQRAFEQTIDRIFECLAEDPGLHVYHYASYEPSHLGKLMGRYSTRQDEVDRLFRGDRLIDLFQVVRQGLRASVESYSIKRLEPLYGFRRQVELRDAGSSIVEFERWLRMGGQAGVGEEILAQIEAYNRDDVLSTWKLRAWLEEQRAALGRARGEELPRRAVKSGEAEEGLAGWLAQVAAVAKPLKAGIPEDERERPWTEEERGRRLLADLLGWHRREQKPDWWRYFNQLDDMTDEERLEAREPLAMLELIGPTDESGRRFRYRFPEQDHDISRGGTDPATQQSLVVEALDDDANEIELRFPKGREVIHPRSLVATSVVPSPDLEQRLLDIGRSVLDQGMEGDGPYRAARDLLLRRPPRIAGHQPGAPLRMDGEDAPGAARRLVMGLDRTTLAIQGPPGSGKTHCGARMILDLVAAGKKVGVTANSHKVIGKLLDDVLAARSEHASVRAREVRIGQKPGDDGVVSCAAARTLKTAETARDALADDEVDVVGGTAWLWASEKLIGAVDVLFIDEAGQFSLANALAVSTAAQSLVLLGDPQQLDQPLKGSHPRGAERSALAHLLDPATVMPPDRGLFLERTWRLHPEICTYTSEVFYESALRPEPGNERQALRGVGRADGEGIRFVEVDHEPSRNDTDSAEEAEAIADLVCQLLDGRASWTDRTGMPARIVASDILVITPYNAQRKRITRELARRGQRCTAVPVGTVDKFQGQQAPISIYSMATSRPEDAPRGMEFLYSLNRLNVATSRARCLTLVVASPALVRVNAHTPRQMQLANALCRLVEVAGDTVQA
ncbi:MAG TPA: TM0106 family RecB-like putative nuclease [Candidatus Limnocylindrales bacterium]|nr:TM0106 family RecB-like putative nuclease [Candidatus Limnocylindrales bacterium]